VAVLAQLNSVQLRRNIDPVEIEAEALAQKVTATECPVCGNVPGQVGEFLVSAHPDLSTPDQAEAMPCVDRADISIRPTARQQRWGVEVTRDEGDQPRAHPDLTKREGAAALADDICQRWLGKRGPSGGLHAIILAAAGWGEEERP